MNALLYALVVVIWGTTWIAISLQQQSGISTNVAVFWRFFISAMVLFAFIVLCRKLQKLAVKDHLFCMLQACCIFGFNFVCFYYAVQYISSGLEAVIFSMAVITHNNALFLRLQTYPTSTGNTSRVLLWMVLALSSLTGWMLLANWRHLRSRQRAQQVLLAETSFRRAMENSLITGMRALDLHSRITHVNAAFCSMTGWSEDELVGQTPPFSFWHKDDYERNTQALARTLGQQISRGGHELRVLCKDGSMFDARMYISPLIGADGQHSGWMSSMTDIT